MTNLLLTGSTQLDLLFHIDNAGDWTFQGDLELDFLADGESITFTYVITVDDGEGGTAQQNPLTITITGTNDAPVITAETSPTSPSQKTPAINLGPQTSTNPASLGFDDLDLNDTHTVDSLLSNSEFRDRNGNLSAPPAGVPALDSFDLFHIDNAGDWTFQGDLELDFLADGESITFTYVITVDDGEGGTAQQNPLTITITGTNDAPVITAEIPDFSVAEDTGASGPTNVDESGSLGFDDLDLTDTHTVDSLLSNSEFATATAI